MGELICRYDTTIMRDEHTGYTLFAVRTADPAYHVSDYGNIVCAGVMPAYGSGMPLKLTGEMGIDKSGRDVFSVETYCEYTDSREAAISFLSSSLFKGIGPKTAAMIADALGSDIFAAAEENRAYDVLTGIPGISGMNARSILATLRRYSKFRVLQQYISGHGGSYKTSYLLDRTFGMDAIEQVRTHPYSCTKYEMSFEVCERIAKEEGLSPYLPERLTALLYTCLQKAAGNGHTCLTIPALCDYAERIEKGANMGYHTEPFHLVAAACEDPDIAFDKTGTTWKVYQKETFDREKKAAENICRLNACRKDTPVDPETVSALEAEFGIHYASEQKEAFKLVESGINIMTGGPGTGKTTVIRGLIRYFELSRPDTPYALCAPTASAAKRIKEASGHNAVTLHKLLGITPFCTSDTLCEELPYQMVIVDEASMMDLELFGCLVANLANDCILILVGDEDQLESVGAGNVLADLIDSGEIPVCRLQNIFRQDEASSIITNSRKIRNGDTGLATDASFDIQYAPEEQSLMQTAVNIMETTYQKDNPWAVRLITPVRAEKYAYGTTALNRMLQEHFNPEDEQSLWYGGKEFRKGDPVWFTRNNYDAGYINGDTGTVKAVTGSTAGDKALLIETDEGEITLQGPLLEDLDLAYTGTVHKAQGTECDICIVLVPQKPKGMLIRKLLYVASTRAKQKTIILSEGNAIQKAIHNNMKTDRITNLADMVRREAKCG